MSKSLPLIIALLSLFPLLNGGCDPSALAPGLTGDSNVLNPQGGQPSIELTPAEQDITDHDYAILYARTANLPEAATDSDGIHSAPMIRWTIESGGGGLNGGAATDEVSTDRTTLLTDPASAVGGIAIYFPALGGGGDVVIKAEVIRPTDRLEENLQTGQQELTHEDIVLASAQAVLHINNELRLRLTPGVTTLAGGGSVTLKAVAESPRGESQEPFEPIDPATLRYEWRLSGLAGAGSLDSSPDSDTAVFSAGIEEASFTIGVTAYSTLEGGGEKEVGSATAVVNVDEELETVTTFGYYIVEVAPDSCDGYNVNAYVYFPKVEGALGYTVVGKGMHDRFYWGDEHTWTFGGDERPRSGNLCSGLDLVGGSYRFRLSAASTGIVTNGVIAAADSRFSGMWVIVSATVRR